MPKGPKIVVDSDLFLGHLNTARPPSLLRLALQKFFCYTTVFHAIELFAHARSAREREAIEHSMAAVKVLGLNAKNAPMYGELMAARGKKDTLLTLAAGLCRESGLPLLTGRTKAFDGLGIHLVSSHFVREYGTGQEILKASGRILR